jgi:anti-anti-sigma factor
MELETKHLEGILIGRLKGRLDASTSDGIQKSLLKSIDEGQTRLALDLADLEYISSAGLRVLLMTHKKVTQVKGELIIFGLKDYIHEIFEIAGFTSILTLAENQEKALFQLGG